MFKSICANFHHGTCVVSIFYLYDTACNKFTIKCHFLSNIFCILQKFFNLTFLFCDQDDSN